MKKRLISVLLCLCMLMTLLPTTALAATTITNPNPVSKVYIAGERLDSSYPYYYNGTATYRRGESRSESNYQGKTPNATFQNGVLTLNGLNVSDGEIEYNGQDLVIVLQSGTVNTVTSTTGSAIKGGGGMIHGSGPSLTITTSGDEVGTLYAVGGTSGFWIWQDTTIEGHARVIAQGETKNGITTNYNQSKLTIRENADVKAIGGEYGIGGDKDNIDGSFIPKYTSVTVANSAKLMALGYVNTDNKASQTGVNTGTNTGSAGTPLWVGTTGTTRADKPIAEFKATSKSTETFSGTLSVDMNGRTNVQYKLGYSEWKSVPADGKITLNDLPALAHFPPKLTISVQDLGGTGNDDDSDVLVLIPTNDISTPYNVNKDTATNGSFTVSATKAAEGAEVTITATPDEGYEVGTVTVTPEIGGNVTVNGTGNTRTFTMPAANVTVNVIFQAVPPTTYTVTKGTETNGTFTVSATSAAEGDTVTITATPATGYEVDTVTVASESGGNVTVNGTGNTRTFTMPAADVTVNVIFRAVPPTTYTVTFAANGHGTAPNSQPVTAGEKATEPTAPTADGYVFGGWYKEAECTHEWIFARDTVNDALTLYAKWTANPTTPPTTPLEFTHAYDVQRSPAYPAKNDQITLSRLREPYLADGWNRTQITGNWKLSKVGTYGSASIGEDNDALTSIVEGIVERYTELGQPLRPSDVVILELQNGGTHIAYGVLAAYDAENGNAVFLGDSLDNSAGYLLATRERSGTIIVNAPASTTYTVTVNNGTASPSGAQAAGVPVTITANAPEAGQQFKEWTGVDGLTFTSGAKTSATATFTMPAEAVVVTATYEPIPVITYTVTFDANGGNCDTTTQTTDANGKLASLPTATRSGYRFLGWYTANGDQVTTDTVFTVNNTTVTAKWKRNSSSSSSSSSSSVTTYPVDVADKSPDGGKVNANLKNAQKGKTVTITVTPDAGYELDTLTIRDENGKKISFTALGNDKYSFVMPASEVEITTTFTEIAQKDGTIVLTIGSTDAKVFGETVTNDVAPIARNNRTLLPIRFVAEALGATVDWNADLQKATVKQDDLLIEIYLGSTTAYVNGNPVVLDVEAFAENNRTYLPLRFIAESLGAEVLWEQATQSITVIPA